MTDKLKRKIFLLILLLPVIDVVVALVLRVVFSIDRYGLIESVPFILIGAPAFNVVSIILGIILLFYIYILFKISKVLTKNEVVAVALLFVSIPVLAGIEGQQAETEWQQSLKERAEATDLVQNSFYIDDIKLTKTETIGISELSFVLRYRDSDQLKEIPGYRVRVGDYYFDMEIYPQIEVAEISKRNSFRQDEVQSVPGGVKYFGILFDDKIEELVVTIEPDKVIVHPSNMPRFKLADYL